MLNPKLDHCRPLRYTLAAVDLVLIAWCLYYVITKL